MKNTSVDVKRVKIEALKGKTITSFFVSEDFEVVKLNTSDGHTYSMYHEQECCESVYLVDICGDFESLIGDRLIAAFEQTNRENPLPEADSSFTWTFYTLGTSKSTVTLRWFGSSNGYYSESISVFEK